MTGTTSMTGPTMKVRRATARRQRHPIPMSCHFEHSLVVTWALPAGTLEAMVPPGLALDLYDDRWGFVAVALVQTRDLRPTAFPARIGFDYFLSGYRLFVRHTAGDGRTRRGLHILRSDTDRLSMRAAGNLLTHYRYRKAHIDYTATTERIEVDIVTPAAEADLRLVATIGTDPAPLPHESPFRSENDARRFAGPLPWTFDYEAATDSIVMIHGRRTTWRPRPVAVDVTTCTFFDHEPFASVTPRLANAFHVAGTDYSWERGRIEENRT